MNRQNGGYFISLREMIHGACLYFALESSSAWLHTETSLIHPPPSTNPLKRLRRYYKVQV